MSEPDETRSSVEVAALLGITRQRVHQLARSLGIGRRIGRDYRFTAADVAALERRNTRRGWRSPVPPAIDR